MQVCHDALVPGITESQLSSPYELICRVIFEDRTGSRSPAWDTVVVWTMSVAVWYSEVQVPVSKCAQSKQDELKTEGIAASISLCEGVQSVFFR
jgi:hypothetical protein